MMTMKRMTKNMTMIEWLICRIPNRKLQEKLWSLLPDNCSIPERYTYITCNRKGVRGNENWIDIGDGTKWLMCDDCHVKWTNKFRKPY